MARVCNDAGRANVKGVDGAAHARDGDRRRLPGLAIGPGIAPAAAACPHALAHPHQVPLPKIRKAITCLVNKERSKRDRPELKPNRRLQLAAQRHNDTMLAQDCFRHRCKGEPGISGRVKKTGYTKGQRAYRFAEDLGYENTPRQMIGALAALAHQPPQNAQCGLSRRRRRGRLGSPGGWSRRQPVRDLHDRLRLAQTLILDACTRSRHAWRTLRLGRYDDAADTGDQWLPGSTRSPSSERWPSWSPRSSRWAGLSPAPQAPAPAAASATTVRASSAIATREWQSAASSTRRAASTDCTTSAPAAVWSRRRRSTRTAWTGAGASSTCAPARPRSSHGSEHVNYIHGGLSRWLYGENIAYGGGSYGTPRAIVRAWMHSPEHRQNILNPAFRQIGIGFARGSRRSRARDGSTFTTDFGMREASSGLICGPPTDADGEERATGLEPASFSLEG